MALKSHLGFNSGLAETGVLDFEVDPKSEFILPRQWRAQNFRKLGAEIEGGHTHVVEVLRDLKGVVVDIIKRGQSSIDLGGIKKLRESSIFLQNLLGVTFWLNSIIVNKKIYCYLMD